MRVTTLAIAAFLTLPGLAMAQDAGTPGLGIEVEDFAPRLIEVLQEAGTDVRLSQPRCSISGVRNCIFDYGSLEIYVDGIEEGVTEAREVAFKALVTTPLYYTFEGVEFSVGVLRPDSNPLERKRTALRMVENLILTRGAPYTDFIDDLQVETSVSDTGQLIVRLSPAPAP